MILPLLSPAVEVRQTTAGFVLYRNGSPYFVKGAGGSGPLGPLKALGGNSVRGWGAENAGRDLDAARRHALTLTVGVWLGHRSYFDYGDPTKVRAQYETVRDTILRHRSHPALLLWGLGNEMEVDGNDTPALWKAIDDLHVMARQVDPNHPAMTVVADVSREKIENIKRYAPHLQLLGINSYGGMKTLPARLKEYGWTKPYVVTEFGPTGPWEAKKTAWGAAPEPTSSEKARTYRASYLAAVEGNRQQCLGSYAFLWGDKQEETPTWFGMLLPTGERTEAADEMSRLWTGRYPANRSPALRSLSFSLAGGEARPGQDVTARVAALDPDGDRLAYQWEVRREVAAKGYAGEGEQKPGVVASSLGSGPSVRFATPTEPGAYRLYVAVRDGKGHGATANAPFAVVRQTR